jgi:hypothetical protein
MLLSIEEFYTEFKQDIFAQAGADSNFYKTVFTDKMCEFLESQDIITDGFQNIGYKKETKGIYADAWSYSNEFERLTLLVSDYRDNVDLCNLTQTDVTRNFKRIEKFYESSLAPSFCQGLEESSEAYEIAMNIACPDQFPISHVRFIIISNASLSNRVKELPDKSIKGCPCSYEIWDITRLHRIELSGHAKEDIEINVEEFSGTPIPCLPAFTGTSDCESFLLVMPGKLVASLYEHYGERLLEQNVRTFLQFRGKINKGLRNTILHEPEMFFAYNNGLTATAESVERDSANHIKKIHNLQIVNGGQTTASLFTTDKKDRDADLSKVYVQMKLSVIHSDNIEEIVPRISEYANTQNKVSAADFFSNHPFHLRIEDFSRRIWAPSAEGDIRETHWFYERARGQYANKQAMMSPSEKKKYLGQNPKNQMFTKTDLAKFENSFSQIPYLVSKGAQANFAKFASDIGSKWDKNSKQFNERYYKHLISKAILFCFLDKTIMKQDWYGGYKANIVTYTISKFAHLIEQDGKVLNLDQIWQSQQLSQSLKLQLLRLAKTVNSLIQKTPHESTNVTQWCKQPACWRAVSGLTVVLDKEFKAELKDISEEKIQKKDAVKEQIIEDGVNVQTLVFDKGADYWAKLHTWEMAENIFTPKERNILSLAMQIPIKFPSEKQSEILIEAESKAIKEGFCHRD